MEGTRRPESGPSSARPTRAGRPRDESKTPQILSAVLEIIAKNGYQALRVQDVAELAGVSPMSVYRRWPTKQELVVTAIRDGEDPLSMAASGNAESDLTVLLTELARALADPRSTRLALLAADPNEPEVAAAARQHLPAIRAYLRGLLSEKLGADHAALDLLVDLGPALVWYRALVYGEEVDAPALVHDMMTNIIDAIDRSPRS